MRNLYETIKDKLSESILDDDENIQDNILKNRLIEGLMNIFIEVMNIKEVWSADDYIDFRFEDKVLDEIVVGKGLKQYSASRMYKYIQTKKDTFIKRAKNLFGIIKNIKIINKHNIFGFDIELKNDSIIGIYIKLQKYGVNSSDSDLFPDAVMNIFIRSQNKSNRDGLVEQYKKYMKSIEDPNLY